MTFLAGYVFASNTIQNSIFSNLTSWLAAVSFFPEGTTTAELRSDYDKTDRSNFNKIKILIVPGHDQESWGTQAGSLKEVDLNIELSKYLYNFLKREKNFNVTLTQDKNGYTQTFSTYFKNNREEILKFMQEKRFVMSDAVNNGLVEPHSGVIHNSATSEASIKLYGINKWANDNNIDIVVHTHFNDYASRRGNSKKYDGFAIYIPESQYSNSLISEEIAKYIFENLNTISSVSNLPQENTGIVEDQELIAIGSNNALDAAGILVEYGYIYERQFIDKDLRSVVLKELAFLTYRGLVDFFKIPNSTVFQSGTSLLPYSWTENIKYGTKGDEDVLRLQMALINEYLYPPKNSTINECPANGSFLSCTKKSVIEFQESYKITPTGFVGPITREKLNKLYSK